MRGEFVYLIQTITRSSECNAQFVVVLLILANQEYGLPFHFIFCLIGFDNFRENDIGDGSLGSDQKSITPSIHPKNDLLLLPMNVGYVSPAIYPPGKNFSGETWASLFVWGAEKWRLLTRIRNYSCRQVILLIHFLPAAKPTGLVEASCLLNLLLLLWFASKKA